MRPGRVARRDGEYQRCGTANVFCGVQPKAGRYFPKVTRPPLLARVCRLPTGGRDPLSGGGYYPFGGGQSEFAYAQGGGGTLWAEGWRLAVGSVYGALHPQARQLAESGRDRDQLVFEAMLGSTPDRRSGFPAERNSGLESSYESSSCSHPVAIYSQEGPTTSLTTQSRGHGTS